jgi:hypothetical protein
MSKPKPQSPPRADKVARGLAVIALLVSVFGGWFNYESNLPALVAKVDLVEPLAAGSPIHFKLSIDNNGKTTARGMTPELRFMFSRADVPFKAVYDSKPPEGWTPTTSDLTPGGHTELFSTNRLTLEHQHDVEAVLAGTWKLYFYGKLPYHDLLHVSHEVHFCRVFIKVDGADPLKLAQCPTYNETD